MSVIITTKDGRVLNTQDIFSIEPQTSSEVSCEFVTRNYTVEEWAEIKAHAPYGKAVRDKDGMSMFHTVDMPIAGYRVTSNSGMCMFIHPDDYKKLLDVLQGDEDQQTQSGVMQGLTQDVFAASDCPDWAEYAAIDANGDAYYYAKKPRPTEYRWLSATADAVEYIGDPWYKDWRDSLIKRER